MNNKEHISNEDFLAFQYDLLKQSEKENLLEHIASCDYCADRFASIMEEEIIKAPRDMKANILKATKRPEVQIAVKAYETSRRMQLFFYSLKVCTATLCALLLLLFSMNFSNPLSSQSTAGNITAQTRIVIDKSVTTAIKDGVDKINHSMLDFSNTIINKEVTDYDQKKK